MTPCRSSGLRRGRDRAARAGARVDGDALADARRARFAPSLVAIDRGTRRAGDVSDGNVLSDVDSCSTCHPDAAAQWATSAALVRVVRQPDLSRQRRARAHRARQARRARLRRLSRHAADGRWPDGRGAVAGGRSARALGRHVPAVPRHPERRARTATAATCGRARRSTRPTLERRRRRSRGTQPQVTREGAGHRAVRRLPSRLPVAPTWTCRCTCRASTSPACGATRRGPATAWRASTRSSKKTCIDCHMEREPATADEFGAKRRHDRVAPLPRRPHVDGVDARRRRAARRPAKLAGRVDRRRGRAVASRCERRGLPADGAASSRARVDARRRDPQPARRPSLPRRRARHPGHLDRGRARRRDRQRGSRSRASRTRPTPSDGTPTCCARSSSTRTATCSSSTRCRGSARRSRRRRSRRARRRRSATRSTSRARAALPLTVTARLRHRSRTLAMQAEVCRAAQTHEGQAFLAGARGAREVALDPCKPQPITLIAETRIESAPARRARRDRLGARCTSTAWRWSATVSERLDEARVVLERALALAPPGARARDDPRAARLGRVEAGPRRRRARARRAGARRCCRRRDPPVLDAVAADALDARVALGRGGRAGDARAPSSAPANSRRVDDVRARCSARSATTRRARRGDARPRARAARSGSAAQPGDRARRASIVPRPTAALAAYDRFRSPDNSAELRIRAPPTRRAARASASRATRTTSGRSASCMMVG